jgi:ABC-type transport system involved in multi-copper enzyme maturation permease subunit
MRALLWKDYQINRPVLLMGLGLLVAPYLPVVAWQLYQHTQELPVTGNWASALFQASVFSLACSQLTLAMLGGNTIACERADRSAEFLAYLPPSRARILASKAVLALTVGLIVWGTNLLVSEVVAPALAGDRARSVTGGLSRPVLLAIGVLAFGVAWLGSSFFDSPTYATALSLGVCFAVGMLLSTTANLLGWPAPGKMGDMVQVVSLALGGVCFAAGSWYYVRRVEP